MTSLVGILSLVSALAGTGDALSCTECTSASSQCSGDSVTCSSNYLCGSTYTETIIGGKTTAYLLRACVPPSECGFNGSISMQEGHIRMVISCCDTDSCTSDIPAFPTQSSTRNGVVCPSCISTNSTWCYTSKTIKCTGSETVCLLQTTNEKTGSASSSVAIRGCTTKSFCDLGSQSQKVGKTSTEVKFICTSGGKRVHEILLTPAVVGLLLLKFFF